MVSIQPISGQTGDSLRPVYGFGVTTWSILSSTYINRETSTLKNLWDSLRLWDSQHIATLCVSHPTLLPRSTLIDAHRRSSMRLRNSQLRWGVDDAGQCPHGIRSTSHGLRIRFLSGCVAGISGRNSKEVQNSEIWMIQGQRWTKSINLFGCLGWVKMLTVLGSLNNE